METQTIAIIKMHKPTEFTDLDFEHFVGPSWPALQLR